MANKVEINDMANEITKWLTEYSDEVTEVSKDVVDKVAEGVDAEIKNHITWKDKKYSSHFEVKTVFEDSRNKRKVWHVKGIKDGYTLTHLLEFGHATRNGGRTKAYPHVKYGDEYLRNNFEKIMKEEIERCKI